MQKKLMLSLSMLTMATVAVADESAMNSLAYRVKAKEIHYQAGLDFGTQKYSTSKCKTSACTTANTTTAKFENAQTNWANDLSYGISDVFSIGLGLDVALTDTLKQTAGTDAGTTLVGSANYSTSNYSNLEQKNSGLGDIKIKSSYRYLSGDVKADALFGISFSGKAKKASSMPNLTTNKYVVSTGDNTSGGNAVQLGSHFAGAKGTFEWGSDIGLNYKMKKKTTHAGGDINSANAVIDFDSETKSTIDFSLGIAGQYNVNSAFAVGASLGFDFAGKEETSYPMYITNTTTTKVTAIDSAHTDVTLGMNGKYQVMSNVDLGLTYSHLFAAKIDGTEVGDPQAQAATAYTTHITDRKDDRFGFSAAVKF